jgi:uncharacterized protein YoxC
MFVDIAVSVVASCFLALTVFLIPVLLQAKKTVARVDLVTEQLSKELPLILKDLREVTENANVTSRQLKESTGRAAQLLNAVGELGESLRSFSSGVKSGVSGWMPAAAGAAAGIFALVKALRKTKNA